MPPVKNKRIISLKTLKDTAWRLISVYVRSLGAKGDLNQCYTCLKWFNWKTQMDCGHYIHDRLDYELNNLKAQCKRCNHYLRGNLGIYGERLISEIGAEAVKEMRLYSFKKGNNYTRTELQEIISKYQTQTKSV